MNGDISNNGYVPIQSKEDSHDVDWEYQNALRKQWLIDNPNARYAGWFSI
jgi:hypothetical protein